MQPDNWEEWWRPACVLDMQPAMWSTRCRRACVQSHAERHTGCHQPEADWLVSPINTPRPQLISSHPDLSKFISKQERKVEKESKLFRAISRVLESFRDQFSIDFESAPREGSVQMKANQMKIISDGNQVNVAREKEREKESVRSRTEKASSVQSSIIYDCDAEALSNSIRPSQSYSPTIKWRCCPGLVQFHGFRSVEVLLDTPPKCPKNCPAAKRDSVQISLSRRVNFFMMKPRLCPSQDQSSPVKASIGFWPSPRLEHCELCFLGLVPSGFKETPYSLDREDSGERCHVVWLSITRRCNVAVTRRTVGCRAVTRRTVGRGRLKGDRILPIERRNTKSPGPRFPLLEARSWQEAKSNLVTVALGKDDWIASCWTLGPPV
ncbi:hypothetical protein YC2023_071997 [Brassica napus]